jgi:hypothetical protein
MGAGRAPIGLEFEGPFNGTAGWLVVLLEKIGRERILEDAGIPPFQTRSKNTSSMSVPRALPKALAEPRIAKPHFSRTRMEAALSLAALA